MNNELWAERVGSQTLSYIYNFPIKTLDSHKFPTDGFHKFDAAPSDKPRSVRHTFRFETALTLVKMLKLKRRKNDENRSRTFDHVLLITLLRGTKVRFPLIEEIIMYPPFL